MYQTKGISSQRSLLLGNNCEYSRFQDSCDKEADERDFTNWFCIDGCVPLHQLGASFF